MNLRSAEAGNVIRIAVLLSLSQLSASALAEQSPVKSIDPVPSKVLSINPESKAPPEPINPVSDTKLSVTTDPGLSSESVSPVSNTELSGTTDLESSSSARQVVEKFQTGLIMVMQKAKELGYQGRYEQLEPIVKDSHDLAGIARIVVGGKQWKSFDEDQKQRLLAVFSRLAIATYAYNFNDYAGESFQFASEKEAKRGRWLVRTLLTVPKGEDVRFDCVLKEKNGRWLIVNIVANGVSDLALKRSEYSSILGQQGFDGLLEKMNGKIEYYAGNKKSET